MKIDGVLKQSKQWIKVIDITKFKNALLSKNGKKRTFALVVNDEEENNGSDNNT